MRTTSTARVPHVTRDANASYNCMCGVMQTSDNFNMDLVVPLVHAAVTDSGLTVAELRAKLRDKGFPTVGRKPALQERWNAYLASTSK